MRGSGLGLGLGLGTIRVRVRGYIGVRVRFNLVYVSRPMRSMRRAARGSRGGRSKPCSTVVHSLGAALDHDDPRP